MSTYSIDSTNNTLTAATSWPAIANAGSGWNSLEVCNVDGASAVTYVVGRTNPTDPTSLQADAWILPATAGASRVHDLNDGGSAPGLYVDVVSAGTPKVLVTAW